MSGSNSERQETPRGSEKAVAARVNASWNKWKEIGRVIYYDNIMPRKLKIKIYKTTIIRPALLFRAEVWALRKTEEGLLDKYECEC